MQYVSQPLIVMLGIETDKCGVVTRGKDAQGCMVSSPWIAPCYLIMVDAVESELW